MANRAKRANSINKNNQRKNNKIRKKYNKDMRDWYVKIAKKRKEHLQNPQPIPDDGVETEDSYEEVYKGIINDVMG